MTNMFKKIITFVFLVILGITTFSTVKAGDYGLSESASSMGYSESESVTDKISTIISLALSLVGIVFFALALYAGVRWMTAQGEEEHITKARNTLIAAVIGLIIVAASYGISNFIIEQITKQ